jgi:carbamoyl-phosphate synthase/aspartate carbamoyltransferase/dihydroorotase
MTTITLPGLIDVHTHLRVPGGEHKEDFRTGTAAALAGGVTFVLAMPNTTPPLATVAALDAARALAARDALCDVGLFAGASAAHIDELPDLAPAAAALKIYMNDTFGTLRVDDVQVMRACFQTWPREKLIAMHAEKQSVAVGIGLAATYERPVHFCHISRREEIELIADAKMAGLAVTCEVTPHHLFMDESDATRLGPLGDMRPLLGTADDVAALWEHINSTVDCIATDHAPHTLAEKYGEKPPPGIPGLETSLGLMLTAVADDRIALERLVALMHDNPQRIYGLPEQEDTRVEVVMEPTIIRGAATFSKCGWSAFDGVEVPGRVARVVLRGETLFQDGKLMGHYGHGRLWP